MIHIHTDELDEKKRKETDKRQPNKSEQLRCSENNLSDNFLADVAALLTVPLLSEPIDPNQEILDVFLSQCPWCGLNSNHLLIAKGILRKDEYKCASCSQRTSKCVQFSFCGKATKSNFLWDDSICCSCEEKIQEVGNGDLSFGKFVQNLQYHSKASKCDANGDEELIVSDSSVRCDVFSVPHTDSMGVTNESFEKSKSNEMESGTESNLIDDLDLLGIFCASKTLNPDELNPDGDNVHFQPENKSFSSDDKQSAMSKILIREASNSNLQSDLQRSSMGNQSVTEPSLHEYDESWQAVREVVLNWPGPERADVDRYRELCSHKAWVRRWVVSCGGDEAWAVRRILAHLKWRQEYRLDTIMDEVPSSFHHSIL